MDPSSLEENEKEDLGWLAYHDIKDDIKPPYLLIVPTFLLLKIPEL